MLAVIPRTDTVVARLRETLSPEEAKRLLRELRSHQVELEQQNENLRATQAALEAARARYCELYDRAPVGYLTLSGDGRIQEANLTAAALLGAARDAVLQQLLSHYIYPADQEAYYRHHQQLRAAETRQVCELRFLRAGATPFWARLEAAPASDAAGAPVYHAAISDITENKQVEEASRTTLALLNATWEATGNGILVVNLTGRLLKANRRFAEMWHLPGEILAADDGALLLSSMSAQLAEREAFLARVREISGLLQTDSFDRLKLMDGRVLECVSTPMRVNGEVCGRVWSWLDVTHITQAEARKSELEAGLRRLDKAESLSRMAGAIAHHFNNYLHAVMGNLELALDEPGQTAALHEALNAAMQAADRAATISHLMLTYLGNVPGGRRPCDLMELCQQFLPILRTAMPKDVTLSAELPLAGATVNANANQLQQVLTNLVTNAWEACEGGPGRIRLSVTSVVAAEIPAEARFPVAWKPQDQPYVCLDVTDTGAGIDAKDVENLFDPFFTRKFIGRGLGLAVTLGIVHAHRGVITVASLPGQGSTFRVYLPLLVQTPPRPLPPVAATRERSMGGTVLLVDDDPCVRRTTACMLTRLGFTPLVAEDGVSAVALLREHPHEICCVLCDLTMPGMNGWETLAALRQLGPQIPMILASGYDKAEVLAGEHRETPQAFLSKPYNQEALHEVLDRLLAGG